MGREGGGSPDVLIAAGCGERTLPLALRPANLGLLLTLGLLAYMLIVAFGLLDTCVLKLDAEVPMFDCG